MSTTLVCDPIEQVLQAYGRGDQVIIVDDEDRENEGDLAFAAQFVSSEKLAFMMNQARGLICLSLTAQDAERLKLPLQVQQNNSAFNTPFALSVDHVSVSTTGVTAAARAKTIQAMLKPNSQPADFICPGHVFPLIANPRGVIGRQGQTEGSLDLARMAGCHASAVICEILNSDGSMAKGQQIKDFASKFDFKITSVAEIIKYRVRREVLLRQVACSVAQTEFGECQVYVFHDDVAQKEHLAVSFGDLSSIDPLGTLVRVHSECLTGDVFGSRRCDCGAQLKQALRVISKRGKGLVLYLRQEGRGIGLANKIKSYKLQDQGADTVEANLQLGFPADLRDFLVAAKMLQQLKQTKVRLLTNNPDKLDSLEDFGIEILDRLPLVIAADQHSARYLETKREKMGHWL